jgi:LacI family transcriptional regulator
VREASRRVGARPRPHVALLVETSLASGRDILRGIARYVREHDPWALYHEPHSLEESVPAWLKRWRGDGIIARVQSRRMAAMLAATGIPVIDVLGIVPKLPFPLVHVDDTAIARLAADHLIGRGMRRFGYFGIEGENWSEARYAGFCTAVAAFQAQVPAYRVSRDAGGRRSWERAENKLARWVAALPKPSGVLVCSDQRGAQFLEACRRADVVVPDEIAVISVDNDEPLCEVCQPALTSIEPGHQAVGYRAAETLDRFMRSRSEVRMRMFVEPRQVITRGSTDVVAVDDASVGAALRIIREHAHQGIRVDAIAQAVGVSRSVLQRRFRASLKRSLHQELLAARIRHARELLLHTALPLAAVAERAGFKHQEYMGAVFRDRLGRTPAQVREESA